MHLQDLDFADSVDASSGAIDVLLGADYFYEIVTGNIRKGSAGPVAISSKLGWLISGPIDVAPEDLQTISNCVSCKVIGQHLVNESTKEQAEQLLQAVDNENELIETLKQFWKTESVGIEKENERNEENQRKELDTAFTGKNYQVSLPWKDDISEP